MVVVPLSNVANEFEAESRASGSRESGTRTSGIRCASCVELAAGGTLLAGGLLLLAGRRRAGLVAAVSGATLALLDQQEAVRSWRHTLPRSIDEAQRLLAQVQDTVVEVAAQRERLRQILER